MTTCWSCKKEIAEGVSSCPHCRVPVTKKAVDAMATIGPGGAPSVQIVPGSVVSGRYEVRHEIGRGGMGIVYLAFDRTMELEVALKVIPQELCMDPRAIADLKRETGIALKLTHPHIMRLHTLDTWEGQAYVVMEYVGGGTLAHLLAEKQRLSLDDALPLLQQIAAALDYSHTTSPAVIHRDLKPLNILLTDQGQIKVADFGLARVLQDSASRVSGGDSAGTLAYMAPEQIRGKGIGRHTDIYALAAISYEMLAGHPPYHTGDLRWQIMHEEPESIADQLEPINQVLLSGLAKEIDDRPASAEELVNRLQSGEGGQVHRAPQPAPKGGDPLSFPESNEEDFTSIVPEPPVEQLPEAVKKGIPKEWFFGLFLIVAVSGGLGILIRGIQVKSVSYYTAVKEPVKEQAVEEDSGGYVRITPESAKVRLTKDARLADEKKRAAQARALRARIQAEKAAKEAREALANMNMRILGPWPGKRLYDSPAVSPDKQRMVRTLVSPITEKHSNLMLCDKNGSSIRSLTKRSGVNVTPVWSPDGKEILYVSNRSGSPHVYKISLENYKTTRVSYRGSQCVDPWWSKDGTYAFCYVLSPEGQYVETEQLRLQ